MVRDKEVKARLKQNEHLRGWMKKIIEGPDFIDWFIGIIHPNLYRQAPNYCTSYLS